MAVCTTCGAHTSTRATRGPLTTETDPPQAYWRGRSLGLTTRQAAVMHLLCHRGEASHLALLLVGIGEESNMETLGVVIHHLRKRLPPGLAIESVRGWGYRLVIEDAA